MSLTTFSTACTQFLWCKNSQNNYDYQFCINRVRFNPGWKSGLDSAWVELICRLQMITIQRPILNWSFLHHLEHIQPQLWLSLEWRKSHFWSFIPLFTLRSNKFYFQSAHFPPLTLSEQYIKQPAPYVAEIKGLVS